MNNFAKKNILIICLSIIGLTMQAQQISVFADKYQQNYIGGGASIGLYIGHFWSMKLADQEAFMKLMYGDCNTHYIQDYLKDFPSDKPSYFENLAKYYNMAKKYNPDIEFACVFNNYPDALCILRDGNKSLNIERVDIYDELARWYFEVLEDMHLRGVKVSIINLVNEPDFDKPQLYGYTSNQKGVSEILDKAIPKLKAMLADPVKNKYSLQCPLIMGPSCLDTKNSLNYINYFKTNYPSAWNLLDIVSTHQYNNGNDWNTFQSIKSNLGGRRFIQSEMHTNRGDDLGALSDISKEHRGALSLAAVFFTAINSGVDTWWYFQDKYPQDYHDGGLVQVAWGGTPKPFKSYYAFKQLNTTQSPNAAKIDFSKNTSDIRMTSFRKVGENKVVVHLINTTANAIAIDLKVLKNDNSPYPIKSLKAWQTDSLLSAELIRNSTFASDSSVIKYNVAPYALVSLELVINTGLSSVSNTTTNGCKIFPTQFNSELSYTFAEDITPKEVSIYNVQGVKIKNFSISSISGSINVADLVNGFYFVELKSANNSSQIFRVLK